MRKFSKQQLKSTKLNPDWDGDIAGFTKEVTDLLELNVFFSFSCTEQLIKPKELGKISGTICAEAFSLFSCMAEPPMRQEVSITSLGGLVSHRTYSATGPGSVAENEQYLIKNILGYL